MENLHDRGLCLLEKVKPDIHEHVGATDLIADGILDSMDVMNAVAVFEDGFHIEFDPDDIVADNFATLEKMTALVKKYVSD